MKLLLICIALLALELNFEAARPLKNPWIGVPIPVPATLC